MNPLKKIIAVLPLILLIPTAYSGESQQKISYAYFGEFISHPGLSVGLQKPLVQKGGYSLQRSFASSYYVHARNHHGLLLTTELINRFTSEKNRFVELGVGLGYMHTWLQGDVYVRGENYTLPEIMDWGRPHVVVSSSFGYGWESRSSDIPREYFTKLVLFGEYPFNGIVLPHVAVQLGTSIAFRGFR